MADTGKVLIIIGCIGMAGAVETNSSWLLSLLLVATGAMLILSKVLTDMIDAFHRELSCYNDYKEYMRNKARKNKNY